MKTFKYKKYLPQDLGKILYFDNVDVKTKLKDESGLNILFSVFSFMAVCLSIFLFYYAYENDSLGSLYLAILLTPLSIYYLYAFVSNIFILKIDVVCDKGIITLYLDKKENLKKKKEFHFRKEYELHIKQRKNLHLAGKYRYTYDTYLEFSKNGKSVFELFEMQNKRFFDETIKAFKVYKITRNWILIKNCKPIIYNSKKVIW